MQTTKDYLDLCASFRENQKPKGWKYTSIEDFILKNGRQMGMKMESLPIGIKRGKSKQCFKNAYLLALAEGFTYCEGYANDIVTLMHAWCLNKKGKVIDPTWKDGKDYFGVEIPIEVADRIMAKSGHYGILDTWMIKFPLLTGEESLVR